MRKPFLLLVLIPVLLLASCEGRTTLKETDYYKNDVVRTLTEDLKVNGTMEAFAEDLCVLPREGFFDETLFVSDYVGLFSETDKEVLYAKGASQRLYPASVTKCMTALLVLKNVSDLEKEIIVGEELTEGITGSSSMAGLVSGCAYTYKELLYALLVPSGNDAANALAYHVGGSIENFVNMMNEEARSLGMLDTHFANPHGLHDKNHYTTVYDLYLLLNALKDYPEFQECSGRTSISISGTSGQGEQIVHSYTSGNSYLRGYTVPPDGLHIVAAKTGYTAQAGRCLVLTVINDEGDRYYAIVCHSDTYDRLYAEMNALLSVIGQ